MLSKTICIRGVRGTLAWRFLGAGIAVAWVAVPASFGAAPAGEYTATASSVARGDWFMVESDEGTEFFSLADVECAPVAHPLGKEAKALVRAAIADATVRLTLVERRTPTLARVTASLDGLSLSAVLVSEGLAVIRPGVEVSEKLIAERDRARSLRLGFWSDYGVALEALREMDGRYGELIEELERLHADEILDEKERQLARLKEIQRVISDEEWRKVTTRVASILSPGEFRGVAWAYPPPSIDNIGYFIEALGDWELGPVFSSAPSRERLGTVGTRGPENAAILASRIEENLERLRAEGRAKNEAKRLALEAQARANRRFLEDFQAGRMAEAARMATPFAGYPTQWYGPQSNLIVNGRWMPPWSRVFIFNSGGSRFRNRIGRAPHRDRHEERRSREPSGPRDHRRAGL